MEMTHKNLCDIAVKWLKRSNSNGGHGCHVAISEVASGWSGEIPDAIGFRSAGDHSDGSVVVEIKMSRADFLADKKKPHRNGVTIGLGNWRYYMCPVGLIEEHEIPNEFGLIYVNQRGHIKAVKSPFLSTNESDRRKDLNAMFIESDTKREKFIMIRLLSRLGDPEKLNNELKTVRNNSNQVVKKYNDLVNKHKALYREKTVLSRKLRLAEKQAKIV